MTAPIHNPALILPGAGAVAPSPSPACPDAAPRTPGGPAFADLLRRESGAVDFSKHARQRIERRDIDVGPEALQRLQGGIDRAAGKGARDAVVLVDGTAFVVSVRNRTVITAVDPEHMREQVFTNIDSAVIA
jgi:flagellar operon protein